VTAIVEMLDSPPSPDKIYVKPHDFASQLAKYSSHGSATTQHDTARTYSHPASHASAAPEIAIKEFTLDDSTD
jgi:hypothetical protein